MVTASGTVGEGGTWELDDSGRLSIFGNMHELPDYLGPEDAPWYQYRQSITEVELADVVSVGNNSFCNYPELRTVYGCPISSIGQYAFEGCKKLSDFNGNAIEGLDSIGQYAFAGCVMLTADDGENSEFTLRIDVTDIGRAAFGDCTSLTVIDCNADSIGRYAFGGCYSVIALHLSNASLGEDCLSFGTSDHRAKVAVTAGDWANMTVISQYIGQYTDITLTYFEPDGSEYVAVLRYDTGGSGPIPSQRGYWMGESTYEFRVTLTVPQKLSFTFKEWNTASDGTGRSFSPNGHIDVSFGKVVTLYAIYEYAGSELGNCVVSYDLSRKAVSIANPNMDWGQITTAGVSVDKSGLLPRENGAFMFDGVTGFRYEMYILRNKSGDAYDSVFFEPDWYIADTLYDATEGESGPQIDARTTLTVFSDSQYNSEGERYALRVIALFSDGSELNTYIAFSIGEPVMQDVQVGAPIVYLRKRMEANGIEQVLRITGITKFESNDSVTLLRAPILCYPVRCRYIIDAGVTRTYTISFIRPTPEEWDDESLDDTKWSNAKWVKEFYTFFDFWQNLSHNSEGKLTGGFLFTYEPANTVYHQRIYNKNVFLKGSAEARMERGRFSASLTLALANMQAVNTVNIQGIEMRFYSSKPADISNPTEEPYMVVDAFENLPFTMPSLPSDASTGSTYWTCGSEESARFSEGQTVEWTVLGGNTVFWAVGEAVLSQIVLTTPKNYEYTLAELAGSGNQCSSIRIEMVGAGGSGGRSYRDDFIFETDIHIAGGGGSGYPVSVIYNAINISRISVTVGQGGRCDNSGPGQDGAASVFIGYDGDGNQQFAVTAEGGKRGHSEKDEGDRKGGEGQYSGGAGGFSGTWSRTEPSDGTGSPDGYGNPGKASEPPLPSCSGGGAAEFRFVTLSGSVYTSTGGGARSHAPTSQFQTAEYGGGGGGSLYTTEILNGGDGLAIITIYGGATHA